MLALDDLSEGRLDLGLGPGSQGFDASALGQVPLSAAERLARFEGFLRILKPIVDGEPSTMTTMQTEHYGADEAPSTPGAVQRRIPLTLAAGARKGLRLAATYGDNRVTTGPTGGVLHTPENVLDAAQRQIEVLAEVLAAAGRDPSTLGRVLLWMPTEPVIESADQLTRLPPRTLPSASISSCCTTRTKRGPGAATSRRSRRSRHATRQADGPSAQSSRAAATSSSSVRSLAHMSCCCFARRK